MSPVEIRTFTRADRDQVTDLVNAHVGAVVPGVRVTVSGLLSQLEREPGEFIVDPWVVERATLVAEQRGRVVAAAHLLRYGDDDRVGAAYRGAGEIAWFVHWLDAPFWPDASQAAPLLMDACLGRLTRWGVTSVHADGALPAPGVYGVPEQWPHLETLYEATGFAPATSEFVLLADVEELPSAPCGGGLTAVRSLGINGTRITAALGSQRLGYVEIDSRDESPRTRGTTGLADIGNLYVEPAHRRQGVGSWLLARGGEWLRLGGGTRLLAYAGGDEDELVRFLQRNGFHLLTRTRRAWTLAR